VCVCVCVCVLRCFTKNLAQNQTLCEAFKGLCILDPTQVPSLEFDLQGRQLGL
jgi:hypothetical protein